MPFANAPNAFDSLTADGDAAGYVTVADNAKYYPGARIWLRSNVVEPKEYLITDLAGTNRVGLREVLEKFGGATYGRTPVTQWKVAEGASVAQTAQTVAVEWNHQKLTLV